MALHKNNPYIECAQRKSAATNHIVIRWNLVWLRLLMLTLGRLSATSNGNISIAFGEHNRPQKYTFRPASCAISQITCLVGCGFVCVWVWLIASYSGQHQISAWCRFRSESHHRWTPLKPHHHLCRVETHHQNCGYWLLFMRRGEQLEHDFENAHSTLAAKHSPNGRTQLAGRKHSSSDSLEGTRASIQLHFQNKWIMLLVCHLVFVGAPTDI